MARSLEVHLGKKVVNKGIVLFGHGARDPQWAQPMQKLKGLLVDQMPTARVELAFLELMSPSLLECVSGLVEQGCESIEVVPIFFGRGGHLKNDFPVLMRQLNEQHPHVPITASTAVGEWDEVWLAIADRIAKQQA